jgi:hypothetical protein
MRGKFVWADGQLRTGEGMENSKSRPLHHMHILQAMIDDGQLPPEMPESYIAGGYQIDPFMDDRITGNVV